MSHSFRHRVSGRHSFLRGCILVLVANLAGCTTHGVTTDASLQAEVYATERAFARTMTDRDFDAFAGYLADDTIFFSAGEPLRGKTAVLKEWQRYFTADAAPFSWDPGQVVVLKTGSLALSTGPVRDPAGSDIATFTSVWRRDAPGIWRIVFDKGSCVCPAVGDSVADEDV